MKKLLCSIIVLVLASCSEVYAAGSTERGLETTYKGATIPTPAWNGKYSQTLSVVGIVVDMSKDSYYAITVPTANVCFERFLPTANANKALYPKTPVLPNVWQISMPNKLTPFVNISGCTSGFLKRHNYLP